MSYGGCQSGRQTAQRTLTSVLPARGTDTRRLPVIYLDVLLALSLASWLYIAAGGRSKL